MKEIVRNNIIPLKGYKAIALWPFVFVRNGAKFSEEDATHERIHLRQQEEMLVVFFYVAYCFEFLIRLFAYRFERKKAYRSISFEEEAYNNQSDTTYLKQRRRYSWLKYL